MHFVFDLDGTICFSGKPISTQILKGLDQLVEDGHEVVFASARPIRDMLPVIHERFQHVHLIGGNGSLHAKEGTMIYATAFSQKQVNRMMTLIQDHQAEYLIDSEWDYAYTGPSDHPILDKVDALKSARRVSVDSLGNIVKILLLSAVDKEQLLEKLSSYEVVVHVHERENLIDISPKNIDKWTALKKAGIQEGHYIAFGNDANDVSMFQKALHSVQIGNHPALGEFANESIPVERAYEEKIVEKINELSARFTC